MKDAEALPGTAGKSAGASRTPRNRLKPGCEAPGRSDKAFGAGAGNAETRIELILPFPPSSNIYWRKTKTGQVYVSEAARAYRTEVKWMAGQVIKKPLEGPVCLVLHIYRPWKRGDLMNREKVLSDALEGIAFVNDSQIHEAHLFLHDDKTRPRVEVCLIRLFDIK